MSATFFDNAKRNFKDVPVVDEKVNTESFLEASESLVTLFGRVPNFPIPAEKGQNITDIPL